MDMGVIKLQVSEEVEKRFREAAMRQFGFEKGSLSLAGEKALGEFAKKSNVLRDVKVVGLGTALRGTLAHVKGKTSVEMQHEISKIRAEKAMKGVSRHKHNA